MPISASQLQINGESALRLSALRVVTASAGRDGTLAVGNIAVLPAGVAVAGMQVLLAVQVDRVAGALTAKVIPTHFAATVATTNFVYQNEAADLTGQSFVFFLAAAPVASGSARSTDKLQINGTTIAQASIATSGLKVIRFLCSNGALQRDVTSGTAVVGDRVLAVFGAVALNSTAAFAATVGVAAPAAQFENVISVNAKIQQLAATAADCNAIAILAPVLT